MSEISLNCQHLPPEVALVLVGRMVAGGMPLAFSVLLSGRQVHDQVVSFLNSKQYKTTSRRRANQWIVYAIPEAFRKKNEGGTFGSPASVAAPAFLPGRRVLIFIASSGIGSGDNPLGELLMQRFVASLSSFGANLWRLILTNGGVRLATYRSSSIESLRELEKNGTGIFICKECLYHFGLHDSLAAGTVVEMESVMDSFQIADKVIRL